MNLDPLGFTSEEWVVFSLLAGILGYIIVSNYIKGFRNLWSPLTLLSIVFFYYCVLGPYYAITNGETYDRLLNMRPYYFSALMGALVFVLAFILGFHINQSNYRFRPIPCTDDDLYRYGWRVTLLGFILFTISTGGNVVRLINPLDASEVTQAGGSIGNYFGLSLNFMIPGLVMLFMYYLRTQRGLLLLIFMFFLTVGIFVSLGFRYRLVLLVGSMTATYYLNARRRPNILISASVIVGFIVVMGIINETREYGKGLDTSKLGQKKQGYFESGLNESRIFQTTGAVIDLVPERAPHVGFQPIISTILFPIPSVLFSGKNSAKYLFDTLDSIYGKRVSQGAAFLSLAEYYLAFGWIGVIGGGMFIGWFGRKLWQFFLSDPSNPMNIVIYTVTLMFLYVMLSRGYMPQVTMLFFFSVFPIFVVMWIIRRNVPVRRIVRNVRPVRPIRNVQNLPHPQ